jgi:hypothetical protein
VFSPVVTRWVLFGLYSALCESPDRSAHPQNELKIYAAERRRLSALLQQLVHRRHFWNSNRRMLVRPTNVSTIAAFVGLVIGFGFGDWSALSQPSQSPKQEQTTQQVEKKTDTERSIWKPDDPVSLYTLVLALFSGLLVTVSIVQIRYLIRADRTARITAEAAKDQTVLTRQAMVDTQRAFVLVKALEVELVTFPYQSPTAGIIDRIAGWRMGVVWENSGDTPTRDLITHVSLKFFDDEIPNNYDFPDLPERNVSKALIGPRGTIHSASFLISVQEAQDVKNGPKGLYMWGWAEYDDVFPNTKRHRTEFCYELLFIDPFPQRASFGHLMYRAHNGADDECLKKPQTKSREKV